MASSSSSKSEDVFTIPDANHDHFDRKHLSAQMNSSPSSPTYMVPLKKRRTQPHDLDHNQVIEKHPSVQTNSMVSPPANIVSPKKQQTQSGDPDVITSTSSSRRAKFILEFDNFSSFLGPDFDFHQSRAFEADGYEWTLILWPHGDKTEGVNDHISIYLNIVGIEELPRGWEVTADVKLFVCDQIRETFFTIKDSEICHFNQQNRTFGFQRFLPLDTFTNVANGYLVNDSCAFGAEVSVKNSYQIERVSFLKFPEGGSTFTWEIKNFSGTETDFIESDEFEAGDHKWTLICYPRGALASHGTHMSLYISLCNAPLEPIVYGDWTFRVKNQIHGENCERKLLHWFSHYEPCWGLEKFLSLEDLYDESRGYIVDNTIIVEVKSHGHSASSNL